MYWRRSTRSSLLQDEAGVDLATLTWSQDHIALVSGVNPRSPAILRARHTRSHGYHDVWVKTAPYSGPWNGNRAIGISKVDTVLIRVILPGQQKVLTVLNDVAINKWLRKGTKVEVLVAASRLSHLSCRDV